MTLARRSAFLLLLASGSVLAQTPAGWRVVHDKTNACQMAVPGDWKELAGMTNLAQAPGDQGDASVSAEPGKTVKPFSDTTQKALSVDKMIDNTEKRIFWASLPTKSDRPITGYHVRVPGNGGACAALISARPGVTEDTVKKMAASLGPSK